MLFQISSKKLTIGFDLHVIGKAWSQNMTVLKLHSLAVGSVDGVTLKMRLRRNTEFQSSLICKWKTEILCGHIP